MIPLNMTANEVNKRMAEEKMAECLECGTMFDESKRTSQWWKNQFKKMGAMAQMCDDCWLEEYKIDVCNR